MHRIGKCTGRVLIICRTLMALSILSSAGLSHYGTSLSRDVMPLFLSVESGIKWTLRPFGSRLVKAKQLL